MLYIFTYGCSQTTEKLILSADNESDVNDYGYQSAQDCWYPYDCNLAFPEDYKDIILKKKLLMQNVENMCYDIYWCWALFDL